MLGYKRELPLHRGRKSNKPESRKDAEYKRRVVQHHCRIPQRHHHSRQCQRAECQGRTLHDACKYGNKAHDACAYYRGPCADHQCKKHNRHGADHKRVLAREEQIKKSERLLGNNRNVVAGEHHNVDEPYNNKRVVQIFRYAAPLAQEYALHQRCVWFRQEFAKRVFKRVFDAK